ncbi:hypothetical protein D3C85_225410 [compost metagenome]
MSAEMITAAAEVAKNVSYVQRLKDLATAHPVGAVVAGTVVATVAVVGGYKLATKFFGEKKSDKPHADVTVNVDARPAADATAKPAA